MQSHCPAGYEGLVAPLGAEREGDVIKATLRIISFLMVLMGIATMVPRWIFANGAEWYGIAQVVIGVIAFGISYSKKN